MYRVEAVRERRALLFGAVVVLYNSDVNRDESVTQQNLAVEVNF